jgi:DNA-binding SARP family transcriptional activator
MRFWILGPIECYRDERRLDFKGPQQLTLLALLLVHGNCAVSNDQLIESLWGQQAAHGALKRLQVAVARLRRTLDAGTTAESPLRTVSGGYRLAIEPAELDADVFSARFALGRRALDGGEPERAAAILGDALAAWRGPALAEVAYKRFAQREIRRLEELRVSALEARAEADLQSGRHLDVIADLASLVVDHPTHEQFTRLLMLALYRSGRPADALEAFQRARFRMAEELGLEPGPGLTQLQAQVLAHDPVLARLPAARRDRGLASPLPPALRSAKFTGKQAE